MRQAILPQSRPFQKKKRGIEEEKEEEESKNTERDPEIHSATDIQGKLSVLSDRSNPSSSSKQSKGHPTILLRSRQLND